MKKWTNVDLKLSKRSPKLDKPSLSKEEVDLWCSLQNNFSVIPIWVYIWLPYFHSYFIHISVNINLINWTDKLTSWLFRNYLLIENWWFEISFQFVRWRTIPRYISKISVRISSSNLQPDFLFFFFLFPYKSYFKLVQHLEKMCTFASRFSPSLTAVIVISLMNTISNNLWNKLELSDE